MKSERVSLDLHRAHTHADPKRSLRCCHQKPFKHLNEETQKRKFDLSTTKDKISLSLSLFGYVRVYVCVCVCVRERERGSWAYVYVHKLSVCVCVCVCVCERERERESATTLPESIKKRSLGEDLSRYPDYCRGKFRFIARGKICHLCIIAA